VGLETIRDQPRAVEQLARALAGDRVAHAYAFVGPAGSGRMTTALVFAGALLCERGTGCGACRGCALVASRQHPDLHVIAPTPPESNPRGARAIRIGAVRELERQGVLRPARGGRRVAIVDEAERMTEDAPQAFLKFLEEPPPGTVVILILPRARSVPATVISRCQLVRFAARDGARLGEAAVEALALLEETRADGAAALFRRTERLDRERAEAVIDGCWQLCRDLLLAQSGAPATLLTNPDDAETLAREAQAWTMDALLAAVESCRQARESLVHNVAPRLTVDVLVSRLARRAA
jgi:DNA polymerase-3 subunit delta'